MTIRRVNRTTQSFFTRIFLLVVLLLIFDYGISKCPDVGKYQGLTKHDTKRRTIFVKGHVEKKFNIDKPVNISSYFRITDIPKGAKTIELINIVVNQYGTSENKKHNKDWQKVYLAEDKEDAKIGYSRPVKFRVWYDVAAKDIKAVAILYNPLKLKIAQQRNNKFKKEKNVKIIELPRQVLYGNWVFGEKAKGGFNMTNKWFFVGIKLHTVLQELKYTNGYKSPKSYWTAFTQPDTDSMGHTLDSLYVRRKVNV